MTKNNKYKQHIKKLNLNNIVKNPIKRHIQIKTLNNIPA